MSDIRMALKILKKLPSRKLFGTDDSIGTHYYEIQPYLNGREAGFAIMPWSSKYPDRTIIIFAESRNTSDLVVYTGETKEMPLESTFPYTLSERMYKDRRMFEDMEEAVRFITGWLAL